MRALLDVNFLVALAWENHQFHAAVTKWLDRHQNAGWATCAITQLGFIRLSCNPSIFGPLTKRPHEAEILLSEYTLRKEHTYLSGMPVPVKCLDTAKILGHQQVTDAYLLQVARHHHAKLVTFDQRLASLSPGKGLVEVVLPSLRGS